MHVSSKCGYNCTKCVTKCHVCKAKENATVLMSAGKTCPVFTSYGAVAGRKPLTKIKGVLSVCKYLYVL